MYSVLCDADFESSIIHSKQVLPAAHITQKAAEIEHYNQPAGGDTEKTCDQEKHDQELCKGDQSEKYDGKRGEKSGVALECQQETIFDQEENQDQFKTPSDSSESDTEQVDTFFNTMSHRYENVAQESPVSQESQGTA